MAQPMEPLSVTRPGVTIAGERWDGSGPVVVMLHEGVADRRSWRPVAEAISHGAVAVVYDRRGFGRTPSSTEPFSHVDDLLAVMDAVSAPSAWLAGTSAGGGIALDAAISAPERVAGLLLLAPAITGAPDPELDPDTARLDALVEQAERRGDMHEINRLETWLWLDGPAQPEGRVGGETRSLALEMNEIVLRSGVPEHAGKSCIDAWDRLSEVQVPVVVACGDLDVPFIKDRSEELARRLPNATYRPLEGVAHLSELEAPAMVISLLNNLLELA